MIIENCPFPDNLSYDVEEKVWVQTEENFVTIGITCIYAFNTGRINTIKFTKPIGTLLERGKSVATVESAKYFGAVRTPISGKLIETNQDLLDKPNLANKHPYANGWFARLQPTDDAEVFKKELGLLVSPSFAQDNMQNMIDQLHVRCFSVYPDYEISGIGGECPETLSQLDNLMHDIQSDECVHLVTDNPVADKDVPRWVSIRAHKILEERKEGTLLHFIIGV
jgi:glycine cleavage system H protein